MKIIDITDKLMYGIDQHNYYCFNGSLVHYKDNLYLFAFRSIKYKLQETLHPWKIWNSFYKKFKNPEAIINGKYRHNNGPSYKLAIADKNDLPDVQEFDSTSLAILAFENGTFNVKKIFRNIFLNEMNQDARIKKLSDNKFIFCYNVFSKTPSFKTVKMKTRVMTITDNHLVFSEEQEMFKNRKAVEKNCAYDENMNIIYELYPEFILLKGNQTIKGDSSIFKPLIDHYGGENVLISGSTSAIKYGDGHIALGHIKIKYKNILKMFIHFEFFMMRLILRIFIVKEHIFIIVFFMYMTQIIK